MDKASDDLRRLDPEAADLLDSAFASVEGRTQVAKAQGDAGRALQGLALAMMGRTGRPRTTSRIEYRTTCRTALEKAALLEQAVVSLRRLSRDPVAAADAMAFAAKCRSAVPRAGRLGLWWLVW